MWRTNGTWMKSSFQLARRNIGSGALLTAKAMYWTSSSSLGVTNRLQLGFFASSSRAFGQQRVVVTDKLRSYGAALKCLAPGIEHRSRKGPNNRSEGSHRPTRRREKIMGRFKSPRQAQRFLSVHDQVQTIFRPRRHTLSAAAYRQTRADAHWIWDDITRELKAA